MSFEIVTREGPGKHMLEGCQSPHTSGTLGGGLIAPFKIGGESSRVKAMELYGCTCAATDIVRRAVPR